MIRPFLRILPALLAAVLLAGGPARAQTPVADTSFAAPGGGRVLQHTVEVKASLPEVWAAFTTSEGLRSWAVPVAEADFRPGGIWESTYNVDGRIGAPGNIQNRYLSYIPMRMVSWQVARTPPGFPHPDRIKEIVSVAEFAELGSGRVKVTLSMVGYGSTEADQMLYGMFQRGNATSLDKLRQRFASGPIDWRAERAAAARAR